MSTTMERNLKDALQHRRSYYELTPESPIDDAKIEEIIHFAIRHIPSAFNSQSTRLVARTAQSVLGDRETDPASHRSRRGVRRHGAEDRPQFRIGIRHGALLRGYDRRAETAGTVPDLCGQFPDLVGAHLGHAPAGGMDNARRRRVRRVAPALQPAHRQRGA